MVCSDDQLSLQKELSRELMECMKLWKKDKGAKKQSISIDTLLL
jgi:hypothetical protein